MESKKNREQIIKAFLGLEELSPMEAGEIRGGEGKYMKMEKNPKKIDPDIDTDLP